MPPRNAQPAQDELQKAEADALGAPLDDGIDPFGAGQTVEEDIPLPGAIRGSAPSTEEDPFGPPRASANADEFFNFEDMITRIPEGTHLARLVNMRNQVASTGNSMVVCDFVLLSEEASGMQASQFLTLTPGAMWKVQQTMAALGLPVNGFRKSEAINRLCYVNIVHEVWKGNDRDTIKEVVAHHDGAGKMWRPSGMPE